MRKILIGRESEIDVLQGAITDVGTGQGRSIHIAGEAGIGKSALLGRGIDEVQRQGMAVRSAAADESDRRRPLALASTLFGVPSAEMDRGSDAVGAAIERVERLARDQSLAVFVDDLHWADEPSLDVIRAVARRAPTLGILVVTAARQHPMTTGLRHLVAAARRDGTLVELDALTPEQIARLVHGRLGAGPGRTLAGVLADTAGNPFLVCELLSALATSGRLIDVDGAIDIRSEGLPPRFTETVVDRIHLVVPDAAAVLRSAAVLPSGFVPEEVAAVGGLPLTDAIDRIATLVAADVFVDHGIGLAFRHELLRGAVRDASSPAVIAALGRHAAMVMTDRGAAPERLATLLLDTADRGDPSTTDRLIAAARAVSSANPLAAADLLDHALGGLDRDDPRNVDLSIELCWLLVAAGRAREVPDLIEQRCSSVEGFSVPLERALGHALSLSGRIDAAHRRVEAADVPAVLARGSADDSEFVDGIGELAQLRVAMGQLADARALIDWVDRSPTTPTTARVVSIGTARSYLHAVAGEFESSVEWAERARRAVADDRSGGVTAVSATLSLALSLDLGGDSVAALDALVQRELPGPYVSWAAPLVQFVAGIVLYRRGSWDDALAEADAGLDAADEVDLGLGVHWPHAVGALVNVARGDLTGADAWIARSQAIGAQRALGSEWVVFAAAMAAEARDEIDTAAATLELLASAIMSADAPALLLACGPAAVRLGLETGRTRAADEVVVALREVASRSTSPVARAVAEWTGGIQRADTEAIAAAAEQLDRVARAPEAAGAFGDASIAALGAGSTARARELSTQAFARYDALGADLLHRRLRAALRAGGLTVGPRRLPHRARFGWEAITPTERAVIDLVAEGLTNTEIASRLVVSRRTVESHLVRIYTKLGIGNRGQLAAAVHRRG